MKEPIFDFKTQATLNKYLKEWQERLMLTKCFYKCSK